MKSYLEWILETLKGYTAPSSALLRESVLKKIVVFNRPRLHQYARLLSTQIPECLKTPKVSNEVSDKLKELFDLAAKAEDRGLDEDECKLHVTQA